MGPEIKPGAPYWIECALVTRDPAEPPEKTRGSPVIPAAGLSAKKGQEPLAISSMQTTCLVPWLYNNRPPALKKVGI